jgi:site-specific DNA recombinase
LRIVDEALWTQVKSRQTVVRQAMIGDRPTARSEDARRPRYLFSGLLTCGVCGGGYTMVGARHYGCANVRNRGICHNRLTIRRDALEDAVLNGLKHNLLQTKQIREFVEEYQREFNRQRREQANGQAAARTELAKVERQIRSMIEAVKDGLYMPSMKDEMSALEARKALLVQQTKGSEANS